LTATDLLGWVATVPSPVKRAHLAVHPYVSVNYWAPSQDTCSADCLVEWYHDDDTRTAVWNKFVEAPEPVGYNPSIIPGWDSPTAPSFAALRLTPYRFAGAARLGAAAGQGTVLSWRA
jgi:hypothetical protein